MVFEDMFQQWKTENVFGQLMDTEDGVDRLFTENGIGRLARVMILYTGIGEGLFRNTLVIILQLLILLILGFVFGIMQAFVNGTSYVLGFQQNVTISNLIFTMPHAVTYIEELGIEDYVDYLGILPKLE